MARPLISVFPSKGEKGFKMVHIDYLGGVTPRRFALALQQKYKKVIGAEPVVVVTNDQTPCFWACAMIAQLCTAVPMVAIDTRDGRKKSCIVVFTWGGRWKIGSRIANPDPDGNGTRHTCVAKKS